jgi:hypothetical protein
MARRYYTVEEANQLVPTLAALFMRVFKVRAQLKTLYKRLEERRFAPIGEDFEPAVPGAPADVVRDRSLFKGLAEVLRADVNSVLELGCIVKDLDTGLVDWYAMSGPDEVFLCWRFGEREVGFFHDLEAGFAGRRPVGELLPPELERRFS